MWLLVGIRYSYAVDVQPSSPKPLPILRLRQPCFVIYRPNLRQAAQYKKQLGAGFDGLEDDNTSYANDLNRLIGERHIALHEAIGPTRIEFYRTKTKPPFVVTPTIKPAWGLLYFDGKNRPRPVELLGITEAVLNEILHQH